jgi:hypothetical protein
METCSYLYSLGNHFSHVSTFILQLWPDTCSLFLHALRILPCRIPFFHSSSMQYSTYPALTDTMHLYLSLPAVACMTHTLSSHPLAFRHGRIHAFLHYYYCTLYVVYVRTYHTRHFNILDPLPLVIHQGLVKAETRHPRLRGEHSVASSPLVSGTRPRWPRAGSGSRFLTLTHGPGRTFRP